MKISITSSSIRLSHLFLYRIHKQKLLDLYNAGPTEGIDKNFLYQYTGVPIIPINYNDVILTEDDKKFALSKGISLGEMKKIKSLSYYYRKRWELDAIEGIKKPPTKDIAPEGIKPPSPSRVTVVPTEQQHRNQSE